MSSHRRHDISDKVWSVLRTHLLGTKGKAGRPAIDNRLFINAVFWILRTGSPWRDLPPDYGDWKNTHRRFCRQRDKCIWEKLLEILIDNPDFKWLMIDATHSKVHHHAAGAKGGNQDIGYTKGGKYQDTCGCGCDWYASQNYYYQRYHSRLHQSKLTYRKHKSRSIISRSRL